MEVLVEGILLNGLFKGCYAFSIKGVELELVARIVLVVPYADIFALINSRVPLRIVGCAHNDESGTAGSSFYLKRITIRIYCEGSYAR